MSLVAAVLYTEDAVVSASQPKVHFDRGSIKSQTQNSILVPVCSLT